MYTSLCLYLRQPYQSLVFQILFAVLVLGTSCSFSQSQMQVEIEPDDIELEARQGTIRKQEIFLDVLSGKNAPAPADENGPNIASKGGESIDPKKIAEINKLVGKNEIYQSLKLGHLEALQKCIALLREKDVFRDILVRASMIRDEINEQVWINALIGTTVYSPAMTGLRTPALVELSPDRFLPRRVISQAINKSRSLLRGETNTTCIVLDETTGAANGIENNLWYFREDIQLNAQHWYWHLAFPTAFSQFRPDRRGELFYYFHQTILARYNSERLSNNLPRTISLKADTNNETIQERYVTYLTDVNSGINWGSRPPNQKISYEDNLPYLPNVYNAIDSKTLLNSSNGKTVDIRNIQGIDLLGDVVERSAFSINPRLYGSIHNNGHNLISKLGSSLGVMADTTTSMRDIVFYRWHGFVNDIFERHKALLPEYSAFGGDYPLAWPGVQVIGVQINSGPGTPVNCMRTFWSMRSFDISRGLDLERSPSRGPVSVCIKHLNHDPFMYTINIVKQNPTNQRASIRIFLAPRFDIDGTRFNMEEQRKLIFVLDTFSVNLTVGHNVITRNSSSSSFTKPWSKTFEEIESDLDKVRPPRPECGCGWAEHLLLPKGTEGGMIFDLFVIATNGAEDSSGNLGDQSAGTCSQPYHYCGIRNESYPDRKPMGFPFDRHPPFLVPGIRVGNLDEFVRLVPNSGTVQVIISHVNRIM